MVGGTEEFKHYKAECAKVWLRDVSSCIRRVNRLEAEYVDACESIGTVGGMRYDGAGIRNSYDANDERMMKEIERIETVSDALGSISAEWYDHNATALHVFLSLECNWAAPMVMVLRYLNLRTWQSVADDVGISIQHAYGIHRDALAECYDKMPLEYRDPMHKAL